MSKTEAYLAVEQFPGEGAVWSAQGLRVQGRFFFERSFKAARPIPEYGMRQLLTPCDG